MAAQIVMLWSGLVRFFTKFYELQTGLKVWLRQFLEPDRTSTNGFARFGSGHRGLNHEPKQRKLNLQRKQYNGQQWTSVPVESRDHVDLTQVSNSAWCIVMLALLADHSTVINFVTPHSTVHHSITHETCSTRHLTVHCFHEVTGGVDGYTPAGTNGTAGFMWHCMIYRSVLPVPATGTVSAGAGAVNIMGLRLYTWFEPQTEPQGLVHLQHWTLNWTQVRFSKSLVRTMVQNQTAATLDSDHSVKVNYCHSGWASVLESTSTAHSNLSFLHP